MTRLDKIIQDSGSEIEFKAAVAKFITGNLAATGTISKEHMYQLIEDAIEWGIEYQKQKSPK